MPPLPLKISSSWHLVLSAQAQAPEQIAAEELLRFLDSVGIKLSSVQSSLSPAPRISLATAGNTPRDGFRIYSDAHGISVVGSNSRSVLYAVYRLIDWLRGDRQNDTLNIEESAYFQERWMPPTLHGRTDDERNFRGLARLGVNGTYASSRRDESPETKHLTQYVRDDQHLPQISRVRPPIPQVVQMLQAASRKAQQFGMEVVLLLDEPLAIVAPCSRSVECDGALPASLLAELPPEMYGTANCPRYRADGWQGLNPRHPKVEAHYRELITQLLQTIPELKTLYVYNDDGGSALIYPPADPYGQYPAGYQRFPYVEHLHMIKLIFDQGRKVRPEFQLATMTYHWFRQADIHPTMVAGLPTGSMLITLGDWDCCLETNRLPEWTQEVGRLAKARGDLVWLGEDDFNATSDDLLMEITTGFPIPMRTYQKCRMWAELGARGITHQHVGAPTFGVNSICDLAFREFTWRPLVSPAEAEARIQALWRRQLGSDAAVEAMMAACREIDRALDAVQKDTRNRPYIARLWHSDPVSFPPHLQEGLVRRGKSTGEYCGDNIDPQRWEQMLAAETNAYSAALTHAQRACALAPEDQTIFYELVSTDRPMSCRDYATVVATSIEVVLRFKHMFLNFLRAERATGQEVVAIWRGERANLIGLLAVLKIRSRWMQTPGGRRVLARYISRFEDKLRLLDKHLQTSS